MAERMEVYKCELCGNIVQVLHGGAGELVCCGQPMANTGLTEQTRPLTVLLNDGVFLRAADSAGEFFTNAPSRNLRLAGLQVNCRDQQSILPRAVNSSGGDRWRTGSKLCCEFRRRQLQPLLVPQ